MLKIEIFMKLLTLMKKQTLEILKLGFLKKRIEVKKGSDFGELSLITNKPRVAKIVATVETD